MILYNLKVGAGTSSAAFSSIPGQPTARPATGLRTPRTFGCPEAVGYTGLFANTTNPCAQQTACETAFNTCMGNSTVANCTLASICIGARTACLIGAAANVSGCVGLNGLHSSVLKLDSETEIYSSSDAYRSCAATTCGWLRDTFSGAGIDCPLVYDSLCPFRPVAVVTLLLRGNFTAIVSDTVKRQAFGDAIARDFLIFGIRAWTNLDVAVRVRRMFVSGTRRQQSEQTLVVETEVSGVSPKNTALRYSIAVLAGNRNVTRWEISKLYTNFTGQTLSFLNIAVGTSSTAFSASPVNVTTANPVPTTANPATTRAPTMGPSTTSTSSGSIAGPLTAAAVIGFISALLL
jgi:hypothetical protein